MINNNHKYVVTMIKISAEKIHRTILLYSTLALLVITTTVAAISLIPMYSKLKHAEYKHLELVRDASVNIVNEYILLLKHSAKQITYFPDAQALLTQYQRGELSKTKLHRELKAILSVTLKQNADLIGITRLDQDGSPLISLGKAPPENILPTYTKPIQTKVIGPYQEDKRQIVIIVTPIYDSNHQFLGTDIALFDMTKLANTLSRKLKNETGEVILAYSINNEINIFSITNLYSANKLTRKNNALIYSLKKAINNHLSGINTAQYQSLKIVIAYTPITGTSWGLAVIAKQSKLFASIKYLAYLIIGIIILIAIIFAMGLIMVLRPLSGKVIMHEIDLQQRIDDSQAALKMANTKLRYLSEHDSLTNLGNRRGFTRRIAQELSRAKRHNKKFTLFFIDINKFKQLNDKYGHSAGDTTLIELGKRLQRNLRKEDYIARLGGDELAIIIPDISYDTDVDTISNKIKATVKKPIKIQEQDLNISLSIGIASYPDDGDTMRKLLTHADTEMYKQKNS